MELNEQNVVVEMAENTESEGLVKAIIFGGLVIVGTGIVVYKLGKRVIKPLVGKMKAKLSKDKDVGEVLDELNEKFEDEEDDLDE